MPIKRSTDRDGGGGGGKMNALSASGLLVRNDVLRNDDVPLPRSG